MQNLETVFLFIYVLAIMAAIIISGIGYSEGFYSPDEVTKIFAKFMLWPITLLFLLLRGLKLLYKDLAK